ncbi:acyl-CoA dehydrogenase family protein [Streptomyces sp. NPDC000880]
MFLDEVRVPVANRVGRNDGWHVTMVTLSFERGTAFVGEVVACRRTLGELAAAARANGTWDDPVLRRRLGREAGRALLNGPLVATHLAACGGLPGAADGTRVITCATQLRALVPHFADADAFVVIHGTSMRVRYPKDLQSARPVRSMDPLTPPHRIPGLTPKAPPRPHAVLLTAAEQLGSAARTTETAVQYAKEREQFGQPIGGFQAVKHLCAQMLVRTEVARAAVYAAAVTEDFTEIACAELLADEAAVQGARDCLQVHGGMGFTWEADVHLHLKRAWPRAQMWLTAAEAEEIQAEALASAL